ncbi:hypothetical protein JB92DRAFT_3139434 [Gautieria morchelliformis]|nr:hypothetical protein JB92DRAFT_3139434 [Gautieria morchelliformis]
MAGARRMPGGVQTCFSGKGCRSRDAQDRPVVIRISPWLIRATTPLFSNVGAVASRYVQALVQVVRFAHPGHSLPGVARAPPQPRAGTYHHERTLAPRIPLVASHGFSRHAISLAARSLPGHTEPLSDTAVSALFGPGDDARKALIHAWLDEGIHSMPRPHGDDPPRGSLSVRDALKHRLEWNEPVLDHLPEAFALLAVPRTLAPLPLLDIIPALSHPAKVASQACLLAGDPSIGTTWYAQRASLALVYTAAELHQLTSPTTALQFLDTLLESEHRARDAIADAGQLASFFWRSWAGIIKSRGFP